MLYRVDVDVDVTGARHRRDMLNSSAQAASKPRRDRRTAGLFAVRVLLAVTMVAVGAQGFARTALADPGTATDFYLPPEPLPEAAPGTILRSEQFALALTVPGNDSRVPANATRIMYLSADTHGRPAAVTGTYLEPTLPWQGPGPRPLVAVAPGTQGQGDQCAPSKGFAGLAHYQPPLDLWFSYELISAYTLLARGIAVVVTDYHGLGTPAVHGYVNRLAEAHAVLDSIRAARELTGLDRPSAIFGYSQGGGAAAAAAELQGQYAPELNVRGTYAGAPPADLREVMQNAAINGAVPGVAGGFAPGLLGYVLNGLAADYPEIAPIVDRLSSEAGKAMRQEVAHTCLGEMIVRTMLRPANSYFAGGQALPTLLASSPELSAIVDQQRIGDLTPVAPVLIASGANDDVIPFHQVRRLAADWCARGATVQLDPTAWLPPLLPSTLIGHALPFLTSTVAAHAWLSERLAGVAAPSNCSALP